MASILSGLGEICDLWLGVDASWPGKPSRYRHMATFQRLCQNPWGGLSGQRLIEDLYSRISKNWSGGPCRGRENWRFKKQLKMTETNPSEEVTLERTIARITDDNWVNQVPIASGIDGTRGSHNVDLIHRSGAKFSFIELKVESNHPLFAAFEIVEYGMVYVFSRIHASKLGHQAENLELLRATEVRLQVLAPHAFYDAASIDWLRRLEHCLNTGLEQVGQDLLQVPIGFGFSVFPRSFTWASANHQDITVRRDLLWALHNRTPLAMP